MAQTETEMLSPNDRYQQVIDWLLAHGFERRRSTAWRKSYDALVLDDTAVEVYFGTKRLQYRAGSGRLCTLRALPEGGFDPQHVEEKIRTAVKKAQHQAARPREA